MEAEVYKAAMKEWYWIVIVGAIIAVAFAPSILKTRCPACKKKALRSVEIDDAMRAQVQTPESNEFLVFFRCDKCGAKFKRDRTAPLEDASAPQFEQVYTAADAYLV